MSNHCTVTTKLTEEEIKKIIFCIKSVHNMLIAFEIEPEKDWKISLGGLLKDMEKISNKINKAKEEMVNDKKEYIDKVTG